MARFMRLWPLLGLGLTAARCSDAQACVGKHCPALSPPPDSSSTSGTGKSGGGPGKGKERIEESVKGDAGGKKGKGTKLRGGAPVGDGSPAFNQATFMTTHNSYSGGPGRGGTFAEQLGAGIRFLELDIHAGRGDFLIGHGSAGSEVDHSRANPDSNLLRDWLRVIREWSRGHSDHAPIQVLLDMKENFAAVKSYHEGNLGALQDTCTEIFGESLLFARTVPDRHSWKSVDELRGKVLVVLSGNATAREMYIRDGGRSPSVAVDSSGRVVEIHASGTGPGSDLWYWTGQMHSTGEVAWLRHGSYDSGVTPAVVLRDDGMVIEVFKSENHTDLWYRVGALRSDFGIDWGDSAKFDSGVEPSLALQGDGSVHEIHRSNDTGELWEWYGTVNTAAWTVDWHGNARTDTERFPTATANTSGWSLAVSTGVDGAAPAGTLLYSSQGTTRRIRYPQALFAETQPAHDASDSVLRTEALVWAAKAGSSASSKSTLLEGRTGGYVTRAWDFDSADDAVYPPVNYAATNEFDSDWYQKYARSVGVVQ